MSINLAQLRRLHEAATPGPWVMSEAEWDCTFFCDAPDEHDCAKSPDCAPLNSASPDPRLFKLDMGDYFGMDNADSEFIAAMRNAFPELLDIAEAALKCRDRGDLLPLEIRAALAGVRKEER